MKEIMGKVVAEKSSINYARQNATFALFVYEKNEELSGHLLESWFGEWLAAFTTLTEKKKYVQECLLACSPEDNNCPFILSNLTFAHFSNFLSTRTRSRGENKGQPNSLGVSSYDMAKSALVHLYWMSKYDIPAEFANDLKIFMKGMKRHVAAKKMEDGDSGIIGKKRWISRFTKKIVSCLCRRRVRNIYLPVVF